MKPNILYLHSHDTGRYIQPYGHAIETPHLQSLAEGGVLFRQAFCANPTCSPSRACLLTGEYAHTNGMLGLAHRGFLLNDYSHHIIHQLKAAGYTSALAGVQHIAHGDEAWKTIGYDSYLGNALTAHEAACEYLSNPPDKPFFLSVGFFETHRKFPVEHPLDNPDYCATPYLCPDTPKTREDMARFKASARALDLKMGMVLQALEKNGLDDNTLVICTTDHGIAFPKMKCNLTDGGIGVMLVMRGPGGFDGGKICDEMVSHVDIYPTICELAGIDKPERLQGKSILPLVNGKKDYIREAVFAEVNYHAAYEPQRCARTKRWKYIRRYDDREKPVLINCDDGFSKSLYMDNGWGEISPVEEALYDLFFDPYESHNLTGEARCAQVLADMRSRLDNWMKETNDSLQSNGFVAAPKGARVNDPDGISPTDKEAIVIE